MAEPLNRLISSTQTIGGAASVAGTPSPITPVGAAGIGANQEAAKMAGTPNQKQSALVRNLRETRSEVDQAAFLGAEAPKKSKTVDDMAKAFGLVDKLGNLAGRVGAKKAKAVEDAAEEQEFPTKKYLTSDRMQSVFPGLPQGTADEVSSALAVFMDGVNLDKNDPKLQAATRTLAAAKKPDGSPLFPPDVLQSADAMRKLILPPEAINMTQGEIADQLLSKIPSEFKLGGLNSQAFLDAVGGPGYTEQEFRDMVKTITGKEFDANMSWGQMQSAIKDWQTRSMTDYNALIEQSKSSNENVAAEANARLRELGFFGAETYAQKIQNLDIDKADDIAIPGMDVTLDEILQKTPKGREALIDIIVKGEKDPTFWDSLPEGIGKALKSMIQRARSIGEITPEEIAGVAQTITGDTQTRKGYTQYTKEDGTPQDFTPLQLQALADLGITFDPKNPVPASMVQNPFFRMLSTGAFGRNQSLVAGLLDEAKRSPALMEFLRTADEAKIRNSRMFTDPTKFKNELIQAELLPTTLKQAKEGNSSSRAELFSTIGLQLGLKDVNNEQSFSAAIKDLVANGVTSINGVKITKTVPGKRYQVPVRDLFGRTRLEWRQDPATTVPLSPMEMADLLVGSLSQQTVVDGRVSTLQVVKDGIQAAVDKASAEESRRTNVSNTVENLFKANASIGKKVADQARALTASLPKNRGLMDQLATIVEGPESEAGWTARHAAHKESIRLVEQVIPQLQSNLAALKNDAGIRKYGADPAIQAEMQAVERALADAQSMANFIASVTTGKITKSSKLPDWFRNAPKTATVSV